MNTITEPPLNNPFSTDHQNQLYYTALKQKSAFKFTSSISLLEPLTNSFITENLSILNSYLSQPKPLITNFSINSNNYNADYNKSDQTVLNLVSLLNTLSELYSQITQYKKVRILCKITKKLLLFLFNSHRTIPLIKKLSLIYSKSAKSNFFLSNYSKCEQDFQACKSLLTQNSLHSTSEYATLLLIVGNYNRYMFKDSEAEQCYKQAIELMSVIYGNQSVEFAEASYGLANLYMDMGKMKESIDIITKALEIWQKQFPDELNPKISKSYYLLGNIYLRKGKNLINAQANFERALEINIKLGLEIFQDTADIYHLIGKIHAEQKNKLLFEQSFAKALDISQKLNGKKHSFHGIVYNHMGYAYQQLNMDYEAKECYEQAIKAYLETCGPHHLNCYFFHPLPYYLISYAVAITYKKCGECNKKLKLSKSALMNFQRAIVIYKEKYDDNWIGIQDLRNSVKELEKIVED